MLQEYADKIPQPEPIYITGDFNVRFQATHPNDAGVTGPYTYGKGRRFIDHNAQSNRSLCVKTMGLLQMVEAGSYKTPNTTHQITYRDKTAPPTDWSQFLLDPLIMQQLYAHVFQQDSVQSLEVCTYIRSFLDLPQPLPPFQNTPPPDPTRFQRLDHMFTRAQWLSSINSCRSKLHTGFPSDHYLLVTEIQVKLAQRKVKPSYSPKLNFSKVDQTLRDEFNRAKKDTTVPVGPAPDHTAKLTFFTDGSGSKGKCTRTTPAGWGWCSRQGNDWLAASGPVSTDPQHLKYLGAEVGSNNTGELSAIIEALLFALEHDYGEVVIHSDSKWAILMIQGVWRPKTNKDLVVLAQRLAYKCGMKVHLQWIKGHSGVEGNELADKLANEGRDSATYQGGRSIPLPGLTTPPVDGTELSQFSGFVSKMQATARTLIPLKERTPGKPWITDNTLTALRQAREAQSAMSDNWKQLRNQAKRLARRDRVKWVHDQIQADPRGDFSQIWNVVRRQRRLPGQTITPVRRQQTNPMVHKAFRDHLETKQWAPPHILDHYALRRKTRTPIREATANEGPFTRADLLSALAKTKKGKAPGPDELVNEILQLLDFDEEEKLLRF